MIKSSLDNVMYVRRTFRRQELLLTVEIATEFKLISLSFFHLASAENSWSCKKDLSSNVFYMESK